jgi:hypothetical protein
MRAKIIAVFTVIVLVVGGLSYALTRASLGELAKPGESRRSLAAASAQLELDALLLERWLASASGRSEGEASRSTRASASARAEAATSVANRHPRRRRRVPGARRRSRRRSWCSSTRKARWSARNGSQLMRGDDLGAAYPQPQAPRSARALTGSEAWIDRAQRAAARVVRACARRVGARSSAASPSAPRSTTAASTRRASA